LGLILDIVPNHMSIADPRNLWWWDVLEYGPSGRWAHAFDVDWNAPDPGLKDIVLLPVLGDHRYRVVERKEIQVRRLGGIFFVSYFDQRFPLAPKTIGQLLHEAAGRCNNARVMFFADACEQLSHHGVISDLLEELLEKSPMCAAALDAGLETLNDNPERLEQLLDQQCYRLAYWRRAEHDLDYRRFFDINSLVGLRTEDPRVFDASHLLIGELLKSRAADGLRVDHIDGLANPRAYLERLRALAQDATVHVEKVLAPSEELRSDWPVEGTTGYEFLNDLAALFVPPEAQAPLTELQRELASEQQRFEEIAAASRAQALEELLQSDVNRLVYALTEVRDRHRDARDFSRHELKRAVLAFVAAFPVYRSYVEPGRSVEMADVALVEQAICKARASQPELDPLAFDFLRDVMLDRRHGPVERRFVERMQQLCAPAMAKGVEDTALYRDVRLLALNDVGGSPARFTLSVADFHERQARAQEKWPHRLLATSTHDTKRSEDVRARLVAMAQQPEGFAALARDFLGLSSPAIDGRMKLLALQTLVGAWPLSPERFNEVLLKSAREAKLRTRWTRHDTAYERELQAFARVVLENEGLRATLQRYVAGLEPQARAISLAWTLLKCTCPGVPDIYQGTELWSHALVDPDNRRPVDWARRDQLLDERVPALEADEHGINKVHVLKRALALRRRYPELFVSYEPLTATGAHASEVLAFSRGRGAVVAVALRAISHWGDTSIELPPGTFESLLISDGKHSGSTRLAALFEALPVALLKVS
jgi:(1->4)-alpha-D-glucan 1-alpha-D-glucosylmutase